MIIPDGGLKAIKPNFLLNSLQDVLKSISEGTNGHFCDICHQDGLNKKADMKCLECTDKLCGGCAKVHLRLKSSKDHKVIELTGDISEDTDNAMQVLTERSIYCEKHPRDALKYFCKDDGCVICPTCYVTAHSGHSCSDIFDEVKIDRKRLCQLLDIVELQCATYQANVEQTQQQKITRNDELKLKINQDCAKLHEHIDAYYNQQLEIIEKKKHGLSDLFKKLQKDGQELEQSKHFIQSLLSHGHATEILSMRNELNQKYETVMKDDYNRSHEIQVPSIEYEFQQSSLVSRASSDVQTLTLGKLCTPEKLSTGVSPKKLDSGTHSKKLDTEAHPKNLNNGDTKATVTAATDLCEVKEPNIVHTYCVPRKNPGNGTYHIPSIAVRTNGQICAVMDYNNICIHDASLTKQNCIIRMQKRQGYDAKFKCATPLNNNYLACLEKESTIYLFNASNGYAKQYNITEKIRSIATFENGNIAVMDNSKIYKVDHFTGSVKQYIDISSMTDPVSLAVNTTDIVVIADKGNHCVKGFQFSSGKKVLTYGSYGSRKGQLNAPRGVCIDRKNNIIIADSGNRRLHHIDGWGTLLNCFQFNEDKPVSVAIYKEGHILCGTDSGKIHVIKYM
ncbi:unnamed protein product [Owenia fusiformis]|uniref:B box-type domain-containing protein n=1 Tax=Owenia fusiformis TaxID=6347 RepID=A0A8S4NT14_OWEFU|nr:unnamed protein product [Owenia fusiformis]